MIDDTKLGKVLSDVGVIHEPNLSFAGIRQLDAPSEDALRHLRTLYVDPLNIIARANLCLLMGIHTSAQHMFLTDVIFGLLAARFSL